MKNFWALIVSATVVAVMGVQAQEPVGKAFPEEAKILRFGANEESVFGESFIEDALAAVSWDGEAGVQFRYESRDEEAWDSNRDGVIDEDSGGAMWGYFEFKVKTGDLGLKGLKLGLGGLAVTDLWGADGFEESEFDDAFEQQAVWTDAYLEYAIPQTKTSVTIGRKKFKKPESGDGDVHQGIQLAIKDIPNVALYLSAVNEWMNNASPAWDLDGIQEGWEQMEDTIRDNSTADEDAGEFAYTVLAQIEAIPDLLTISPYVQYHADVATSYGITVEAERALNEKFAIGFDGAYAMHLEDTPENVAAEDDDVSQTLLHLYGKTKHFRLGVGYYTISNDAPIFNSSASGDDFEDVYVMDEFDPMEKDLAKYGEQQNNETWFIDAAFTYGPMTLEVIYGWVDDAIVEKGSTLQGKATELDVVLTLALTKNLEAELAYINLNDNYNVDNDRSADIIAGALAFTF